MLACEPTRTQGCRGLTTTPPASADRWSDRWTGVRHGDDPAPARAPGRDLWGVPRPAKPVGHRKLDAPADTEETVVATGLRRTLPRPCLVLPLAEHPFSRYDLPEQTRGLGLEHLDTAAVYRTLRAMEDDGLVESRWEPSSSGDNQPRP